jgi:hypothetical protein
VLNYDVIVSILIHYEAGMTTLSVPKISGIPAMLENSLTGNLDKDHRRIPFNEHRDHLIAGHKLARTLGVGFVFDPGRLMYPLLGAKEHHVRSLVVELHERLVPGVDMLHIADKRRLKDPFRASDNPCPFGEGVFKFYLAHVHSFHKKGGVVICEHEDYNLAVASLWNILKYTEEV